MKKIAWGVALVLLSTTAYAQTSTNSDTNATSQGTAGSRTMTLQHRSGDQGASAGTSTNVRTRAEGGVRVGVETRERAGVAVHHTRTVREEHEPSVSVTRRRTITAYDEPSTEVHRTVIKKKHPTKKVVLKKKSPHTKIVVKKRKHYVVHEPVEVRRRIVHRYEVNEPSVSVSRRTTIHRTHDVSPRVGMSVEHRTGTRSNDVNVSTSTRQRSSAPEATGSVSTRNHMSTGGNSSGTSGSSKMRMQQQGGASTKGNNGQ